MLNAQLAYVRKSWVPFPINGKQREMATVQAEYLITTSSLKCQPDGGLVRKWLSVWLNTRPYLRSLRLIRKSGTWGPHGKRWMWTRPSAPWLSSQMHSFGKNISVCHTSNPCSTNTVDKGHKECQVCQVFIWEIIQPCNGRPVGQASLLHPRFKETHIADERKEYIKIKAAAESQIQNHCWKGRQSPQRRLHNGQENL